VALTDVDEACQVSGDNPQTITVGAGDTVFVSFHPFCGNPGEVVVHTRTRNHLDLDGNLLLVDGVEYGAIGLNDEAILAGLEPGDHVVTLSGIAFECLVIDHIVTKTVTVVETETAHVDFNLLCRLL
jgi:hypothetical protein